MSSKTKASKGRFVRPRSRKRTPRKVLVMGARRVGKTSLIKRFMDKSFDERYTITPIEEIYDMRYKFKCYDLCLQIIDMAGSYDFPVMRDLNIKESSLIMLLYEVGNASSFEEVKRLYQIVTKVRAERCPPITVVGTKGDTGEEHADEALSASIEEFTVGPKFNHVITSSKLGFNVAQSFEVGLEEMARGMNAASLQAPSFDMKDKNCCCSIL